MVHTGLGPYQTCNFVSVLNIPPANPKTLKKREREVGPNCEESAIMSCDCAAEEEMSASRFVLCLKFCISRTLMMTFYFLKKRYFM